MLVIRKTQMEAFSQYMEKSFEDRMLKHLREFFPVRCEDLQESELRQLVRQGVTRAGSHGFTSERDVARYTDLMFALGANFDQHRATAWAAAILRDRNAANEDKLRQLFDKAGESLKR